MLWYHLSSTTPDYNFTLNIPVTDVSPLSGKGHVKTTVYDDGSDDRVELGEFSEHIIQVTWGVLSRADFIEITDIFYNRNRARKSVNSFRWFHPLHQLAYVVRFAAELKDDSSSTRFAYSTKFKILGR